jgi:glycosyltransferase involved in cell wall biosynthesis
MRITLVNSHPKFLIGGAELFMYYTAREFVKAGHEVHMVSVYPRGVEHPPIASSVEVSEGITIHHLPDAATDVRTAWRFLRILRSIKTDVYLKMFTEPSTILLSLYARFKRIPYVLFMAHDNHCQKDAGLSLAGRFRVHWLVKFVMITGGTYAWALRGADRMLVQNELQRTRLLEHYQIAADDVIKVGQPVPSPLPKKEEPPLVMWNARFQPWKRPELFLELAERLPQVRFVMGGPSKDDAGSEYFKTLSALVAQHPNIALSPFPDTFEEFLRFKLYERASVFVDTVERGGFENTLVQAWLRAVPVVSISRDFDGVLTREGIGVGCHGDVVVAAAAVERLVTRADEREAMGERARAFAVREYDIAPIGKRILWHLVQAFERKPRPAFLGDSDLNHV